MINKTKVDPYGPFKNEDFEEETRVKVGWAKKTQFVLIFLVSFGLLVVQGRQCVIKYLDKKTATGDTYSHVSTVAFPELTICPTYPYKLGVLQENGIESLSDMQFGWQWISNYSTVSAVQLYEASLLTLEDIVIQVRLDLEQEFEGSTKKIIVPGEKVCGKEIFRGTEYYYNGRCFTIDLPDCVRKLGVLEVVADFKDKTDIFIHHKGQFLSPDSRSRVDVDKGSFVKIAVNHEVIQMLPENGACVEGFGPDMTDSYDQCMYSSLQNLMDEAEGCTVPWLPMKENICTEEYKRKNVFRIYQDNRRNQKDVCATACQFTNMYFGPPVTGKSNPELAHMARAVFYFRRTVKLTTEYMRYTWLSLLAELGGYTGLLLGFSLLHLTKIVDPILECFGYLYTKSFKKPPKSPQVSIVH